MNKALFLSSLLLVLTACELETPVEEMPEQEPQADVPAFDSSTYGISFDYNDEWTLGASTAASQIAALNLNDEVIEKTNVHSAAFRLTVEEADSLEACLSMEVTEPSPTRTGEFNEDSTETVNGVTYYTATGVEGAAGTTYESHYKRSFKEGTCFTIEEHMEYSNIGLYEGTDTVDAVESVQEKLDAVFETINFGA